MSRWLFLVNEPAEIGPEQTTAALIAAASRRFDVWVAGVGDLEIAEPGVVEAQARRVAPLGSTAELRAALTAAPERLSLVGCERVWVRTNPARDPRAWVHAFALQALETAELQGVSVVNATAGLRRFGTKPGCLMLPPEIRPRTRVSRSLAELRAFVAGEVRAVLKPASGTHGRGVFVVDGRDGNLASAAELLAADGMVVAQEWLPDARDGDVRMFVVDGEVLRAGDARAVVRRRPAAGEHRSNVHLGGQAERAPWDERLARVAELAGPVLRAHGVRLAGLDVIGGKVVECNVYAPGGLSECGAFAGVDFVDLLISRLVQPR